MSGAFFVSARARAWLVSCEARRGEDNVLPLYVVLCCVALVLALPCRETNEKKRVELGRPSVFTGPSSSCPSPTSWWASTRSTSATRSTRSSAIGEERYSTSWASGRSILTHAVVPIDLHSQHHQHAAVVAAAVCIWLPLTSCLGFRSRMSRSYLDV